MLRVSDSQLAKPIPMKKATVGVIFCSSSLTPEWREKDLIFRLRATSTM